MSIYETQPKGWDANIIVRQSHCSPLKVIAQVHQDFSKSTCFMVGDGARIRFCERGSQPSHSQFPSLFKVVPNKKSYHLNYPKHFFPFSYNLNFHYSLNYLKIEDLKRLMFSLTRVHLTPSIPNAIA